MANKKLLSTVLKHHAISTVTGMATGETEEPRKTHVSLPVQNSGKNDDLYVLPPLPEPDKPLDEYV